ncbi:diguanylate cyclase (GGDEF)-like protein [Tamilnaduibacter salinus]|uniref:diguanylate cyclase n=2 Tax=Tamilnaduibacter salinus TaxID=1484056 RepID=A0A2U1CWE4_9GAMM|nr:diguanylate cyclase (GGDEF)-like protein [Tamilnaduibacter salinus]
MESPMLKTVPPELLTERVIRDVESVIARGGLFQRVPEILRASFQAYRHRDLNRYIKLGSPFLMAMILGIIALTTLLQWQALQSRDFTLWLGGCAMVAGSVLVGILAVIPTRTQHYYSAIVSVPAVLVIAKLAVMPGLLTIPELAVLESYFCSLAIIVVVLALKLSLRNATLIIVTSLTAVVLIHWWVSLVSIDWPRFTYYCVFVALVCLFIAWQNEEREKRAFFQSVMIAYNAALNDELTQRLEVQANQDPLTGLANRRALDRELAVEWERARREGGTVALLYIDVDYFKSYNDRYGHSAGDECLVSLARGIEGSVHRPADTVSRWGGEEFAVLMPGVDHAGARVVADRVLTSIDALAIPHDASSVSRHVTLSIGVACLTPGRVDGVDRLIAAADTALYKAKSAGRHQIAVQAS